MVQQYVSDSMCLEKNIYNTCIIETNRKVLKQFPFGFLWVLFFSKKSISKATLHMQDVADMQETGLKKTGSFKMVN